MVIPRTLARNGWTGWHILCAAAMALLGLGLTFEAWISIGQAAVGQHATCHILLVPFVVAWLIRVRRRRLRFCQPVGTWVGPVIVAIGWLLYTWGYSTALATPATPAGVPGVPGVAWHAGAVLILIGCLISALGTDTVRCFFPAFLALGFLVPLPQSLGWALVYPLQAATADITQIVYGMFGAELQRYGDVIMIHNTKITVVGTSCVLGLTLASVVICYGFAFSLPLRAWARTLIMVLSPVSALLCNVARALGTAWIYGHFNPQRVDSLLRYSGWASFAVALATLLVLVRLLVWASVPIRRFTLVYDT